MATPKENWPVRWEYDLHEREFIARGHPLPVPAAGIFDEVVHCVLINVQWLPHILGALQILLEGDSWAGGDNEIFRAQQEVQKLISSLSTPCSDGGEMLIAEFRSVALDSRCDQNQWKYTVEDDSAWRNLGTPLCDGVDGDDGDVGPPGEQGETGAPGEDCDCGDPVPTQPPVIVGDDRCAQACSIATGLGTWLKHRYDDTLSLAKALFEATDIIADVASDLIDAFPVLGAIVDAVIQYAENLGELDIASLQGASNNEFEEWVQCELYRIMADDTGDFTLSYFDQVKDEIQSWGATLPPQGPLLVVIGQMFALFVETVPASEFLRRANVYKDNTANCDLCDVDCGSSCDNILIDFDTHNSGYTLERGALTSGLSGQCVRAAQIGAAHGQTRACEAQIAINFGTTCNVGKVKTKQHFTSSVPIPADSASAVLRMDVTLYLSGAVVSNTLTTVNSTYGVVKNTLLQVIKDYGAGIEADAIRILCWGGSSFSQGGNQRVINLDMDDVEIEFL